MPLICIMAQLYLHSFSCVQRQRVGSSKLFYSFQWSQVEGCIYICISQIGINVCLYTRECGEILVENNIPYSILMTQTFYAIKSQVASIALKMEKRVLFKTDTLLSVPRTPFNPSQRTLLLSCCFKMITHCSTPQKLKVEFYYLIYFSHLIHF